MRICFVVHRYAPYPGGSEVYVRNLAEESLRRGHETWVLTDVHKGDLDGVRVTSDDAVLDSGFDLIVVHGGNMGAQSRVLERAGALRSPVLYMLVSHVDQGFVNAGMRDAAFLGWSTPADMERIRSAGGEARAVQVRHGIELSGSTGKPGFREKFGIAPQRRMFLSCGGYWAHKRMKPLARLFERLDTEALLVTTGYHKPFWSMPRRSAKVLPLLLDDRADVISAISEANCYIMHSEHEGFGLVLLEAMANGTPWLSFDTGGASLMREYGEVYREDAELERLISQFSRDDARVTRAREYVLANHLVSHSVDDIEAVAALAKPAGN